MKRRLSGVILLVAAAAALAVVLLSRWDEALSRRAADVVPLRPAPENAVFAAQSGSLQLDVNKADAHALALLPGLGETLGQAVVDYRAANGPFHSIDELADVPGLGAGRLDAIRSLITCEEGD